MAQRHSDLLATTRTLLAEARTVVRGSVDAPSDRLRDDSGVLALYEELRERLEGIDPRRVAALISGIAGNVEDLDRLASKIENLKRLRRTLEGEPSG